MGGIAGAEAAGVPRHPLSDSIRTGPAPPCSASALAESTAALQAGLSLDLLSSEPATKLPKQTAAKARTKE